MNINLRFTSAVLWWNSVICELKRRSKHLWACNVIVWIWNHAWNYFSKYERSCSLHIYIHTNLLSTNTKAWQEARISIVRTGTLLISVTNSMLSVNPTTPENSWKSRSATNWKNSCMFWKLSRSNQRWLVCSKSITALNKSLNQSMSKIYNILYLKLPYHVIRCECSSFVKTTYIHLQEGIEKINKKRKDN